MSSAQLSLADYNKLYGSNGTKLILSPNYDDPPLRAAFLIINALVRFLIGMFGFVVNTFLVFVVVRNKRLRNSTGSLLAALAAADALVGVTSVSELWWALNLNYQINKVQCVCAVALSIFAYNNSLVLLLIIALDRLLAVMWPIWYSIMNGSYKLRSYLVSMGALSLLVSGALFAVTLYEIIVSILRSNNTTVFKCSVDDLLNGTPVSNTIIFVFNGATVVCYALITGAVFKASLSSSQTDNSHRIFRSVLLIVVVVISCWTMSIGYRTFAYQLLFPVPNASRTMSYAVCGALTAASQAVNPFILYGTSPLYRECMRGELKRLHVRVFGGINENVRNAVSTLSSTGHIGGKGSNSIVAAWNSAPARSFGGTSNAALANVECTAISVGNEHKLRGNQKLFVKRSQY